MLLLFAATSLGREAPGTLLREQIVERMRKRRQRRDPAKDEFFVQVPESAAWFDADTLPMVITAVAVALFAEVLVMAMRATCSF